ALEALTRRRRRRGGRPPSGRTVAAAGAGDAEVWDAVCPHRAFLEHDDRLERRRAERLERELREIVVRRLEQRADELCRGDTYERLPEAMLDRRGDPYEAAAEVVAEGTAE